ncbi:MAG TPA: glycoside hydrolase family 95 protein, partial [Chitinophagaceae bacterium]
RLLDGNHAYKLIRDQLTSAITNGGERGGNYPNLFDAHPPFQIDGNFGCTSGITEMLLQSADGDIFILPAIPDDWKSGAVKGLMARGGFKVDIQWNEGKLTTVIIHSKLGGNCRIRAYDPLAAKGDFTLQPATGNNPNLFFETPVIKQPLISPDARLEKLSLRKTYRYDLKTEKGKTYTLTAR